VREVGAVAGLAGAVGLAVLAALCWAQARDLRRLSDWADGVPPVGQERTRRVRRAARVPRGWVGARPVVAALAGVLLVVVVARAALTHDGGDGADREDRSARAEIKDDNKASRGAERAAPAVNPAEVTVAVLNGTTVPGLAAALRDRVVAAGFGKGIINDFPDQGLTSSVVQYAPGGEAAARAVGRALGIDRVEPLGDTGRALAGDAAVVVIAGVDSAP
jgi:LytR cell envelope-related transcriptional attenuator